MVRNVRRQHTVPGAQVATQAAAGHFRQAGWLSSSASWRHSRSPKTCCGCGTPPECRGQLRRPGSDCAARPAQPCPTCSRSLVANGLPHLALETEPSPPAGHRGTRQRRRRGGWHALQAASAGGAPRRQPWLQLHSAAAEHGQPARRQHARLIFRRSCCSSASSKGGYPPRSMNRHTPSDQMSEAGLSGELVWPCGSPGQDSGR